MKKFVLSVITLIALGLSPAAFAKKSSCQDPSTIVPFGQVMNPAFVKKFFKCPVTTDVQVVTFGLMPGIPLPRKMKKLIIIQGVQPGTLANNVLIPGQVIGIPKEFSDKVFNLKPGEKIRIKGNTYWSSAQKFGAAMTGQNNVLTFFLASSVEVIP